MKTWIVSDTHFGHRFMTEAGYRPDDYEKRILDSWARDVKDEDTVLHLGDLAFKPSTPIGQTIQQLPGSKILILGNHDHGYDRYLGYGFNAVFKMTYLERFGKKIYFSHEPMKIPSDSQYLNLHGHLHGNDHRLQDDLVWYKDRDPKQYIDMSAECMDYKVKSLESVIRKLSRE